MGLKGRKRRLRNFDGRAEALANSLTSKKPGVRKTQRDNRLIRIGIGQHKGLAIKRHKNSITTALKYQSILKKYLTDNNINPKFYKFVQVKASPELLVQEYFNKPSLGSLLYFFSVRKIKKFSYSVILLNKESWFLCKSFANQNKGITREKVLQAEKELRNHLSETSFGIFARIIIPSNILVLGQTKEGKIKLALVDI